MKRIFYTIFSLSILVSLPFASSTIENRNNQQQIANQVITTEKSEDGLTFSFNLRDYQLISDELDGENLTRLLIENTEQHEMDGMPSVPIISSLFRVPPSSGVNIEILDYQVEVLENIDYAFVNDHAGELKYNPAVSKQGRWLPEIISNIGEIAILHDFRISSLHLHPVQYNPATRQLRIYSDIQVQIQFEGENPENSLPAYPTKLSEAFLPWYRQLADWNENELDDFQLYRGHVQVIVQNNQQLLNAMEEWFTWKRQKGWELELLTEDDVPVWSNTAIKAELLNRWEEAETKFDHIVIIGDNTGPFSVPVGAIQGDHAYALLAGDDQLADVFIGRISIESVNDALIYKNKVLSYERNPDMDNTGWYTRGMVAAGSAVSGISTIFNGRYARNAMLDAGYTRVDTAWYNDRQGGVNGRSISNINQGLNYYHYRGLQGTGLGINTIRNLNNIRMTPLVVDITCGTGTWAYSLSNTEAYMRAGTTNVPKGAIAAMGTALVYTHTRYNNALSGGAAETAFYLKTPTVGEIHYGAKFNLWRNFHETDPTATRNFSEWLNLMGDPTVWFWSDEPHELDVHANVELALGQNSYPVEVTSNGIPLEGAWVTFYKSDNDEEVISRGITDADGTVSLQIPVRHEGEAVLTVTAQNCAPVQMELNINQVNDRISFSDFSFLDDGSDGTSGNGNGRPEAGETVGILLTLENFGENDQQNISIVGFTTDDMVEIFDTELNVNQIDAGHSLELDSPLLLEISSQTKQDWSSSVELEFTSDAGIFQDELQFTIDAPRYTYIQQSTEPEFAPGAQTTLSIQLMNTGRSDASRASGHLESLSELLVVDDENCTLDPLSSQESTWVDDIVISASPAAYNGQTVQTILYLETDDGFLDTLYIPVTLGSRGSSDPTGPDRYGYLAYESLDMDYPFAPVYHWVELNPGNGEEGVDGEALGIEDNGNQEDDAVVIDLPFTVQFYGLEYDELTISSNGFAAFGSQADMSLQRNWTIPSPLGANAMLAPYWDDRRFDRDNDVYFYHDEIGQRIIIQWDEAESYYARDACTFQILIYDLAGEHETPTGDNEIIFQYKEMNHVYGNNTDVPYWTTGIENHDQNDGLMLNYWNQPTSGSHLVENEYAILFTTKTDVELGNITGQITRLENDEPLEGVSVHSPTYRYSTLSDAEGMFNFTDVLVGQYTIIAEREGFNTSITTGIDVQEGQTTVLNTSMTHPMFEISPEQVNIELEQFEQHIENLVIDNAGNGPLDYQIQIMLEEPEQLDEDHNGSELDDPWDMIHSFLLNPIESRNRAVAFDGNFFWIAGSNNLDENLSNLLHKYSRNGEYIASYPQPVNNRSGRGFEDLAIDGNHLIGIDNNTIYRIDISTDPPHLEESIPVPVQDDRLFTFDPENGTYWVGGTYGPIQEVDRDGNILRSFDVNLHAHGMSWHPGDREGNNLYFLCQVAGSNVMTIKRMHPVTGTIEDVETLGDIELVFGPTSAFVTHEFNQITWTFMSILDEGAQDRVIIYEADIYGDWLTLSSSEGIVGPESSETIEVTFQSFDLPVQTYNVWLHITHNAIQDDAVLPLTMSVDGEISVEDDSQIPLEWSFDGVFPNPFNPSTTIAFTLKEATKVHASVFNLLGQEVATIVNQRLSSGQHQVVIDGSKLAAGIYFLNFEAGPINTTSKIILLK
ncbi:carboxypeptidase regulatory-like domain-containing protein [bacterium]|nr:carboxypeptidase regulatory-like domain-containing protein [bacterium]